MGVIIEECTFSGAFNTRELKKLRDTLSEDGIDDDVREHATHVFIATDNDKVIGGAFATQTDTLFALLWSGNTMGETQPFGKKLASHIADNNIASETGYERVVGYFTNDLSNMSHAYFNAEFGERKNYVDTRTPFKRKHQLDMNTLYETTQNQCTWFGGYQNRRFFRFFVPRDEDYRVPKFVLPVYEKEAAKKDVKKLKSQPEALKKIQNLQRDVHRAQYTIKRIERELHNLPEQLVKAKTPSPKKRKPLAVTPEPKAQKKQKSGVRYDNVPGMKNPVATLDYSSDDEDNESSGSDVSDHNDTSSSDSSDEEERGRSFKQRGRGMPKPKCSVSPHSVREKRLKQFDADNLKQRPYGTSREKFSPPAKAPDAIRKRPSPPAAGGAVRKQTFMGELSSVIAKRKHADEDDDDDDDFPLPHALQAGVAAE